MAYSDFSLNDVIDRLGVTVQEPYGLFAAAPSWPPSAWLQETLAETAPLGLAVGTEKARSEWIIAPLLAEVRRALHHEVSVFSGIDFTVDVELGLRGACDFLIARSPVQHTVRAPVAVIVEVKKEDTNAGLGQCAATMVAVQLFNQRAGIAQDCVFGAVTTGSVWKFLQLTGHILSIDASEYYLDRVDKVLGILLFMAGGGVSPAAAAPAA